MNSCICGIYRGFQFWRLLNFAPRVFLRNWLQLASLALVGSSSIRKAEHFLYFILGYGNNEIMMFKLSTMLGCVGDPLYAPGS